MLNKAIGFLFAMLLFFTVVGFAQSGVSQIVHITKGKTINFKASSSNALNFQWFKDGVVISGATTETYIANIAGTYTVISYNKEGCASSISDSIVLIIDESPPIADLMITKTSETKSITLNGIFEYTLKLKNNGPNEATLIKVTDVLPPELTLAQLPNTSLGTSKYIESTKTITWEIPKISSGGTLDLTIKVKSNTTGTITNLASVYAIESDPNLRNNISTDTKQIIGITIPNVFTPNNDGKNDFFVIKGLANYVNNEITIFNRWGSSVYEKKNYLNDWTGSELSGGTYFYIIRLRLNATSKWEEFKGYITLMR